MRLLKTFVILILWIAFVVAFTRLAVAEELQAGDVRVVLYPEDAVRAGASWRLVRATRDLPFDSAWMASGAILFDAPVGSYELQFRHVPDWTAPTPRLVVVTAGGMVSMSGDYFMRPGELQVTIQPYNIRLLGAQWRVDERDWTSSGEVEQLEAGWYTIHYRHIAGWRTPPPQRIYVPHGDRRSFQPIYSRLSADQAQNIYYPETSILELRNTLVHGVYFGNILMRFNADGTVTFLHAE